VTALTCEFIDRRPASKVLTDFHNISPCTESTIEMNLGPTDLRDTQLPVVLGHEHEQATSLFSCLKR
jgi:hypothetical protein